MFQRLTVANFKRLKNYILILFMSAVLLISSLMIAANILSKHIYEDKSFQKITLVYYLPADDDVYYTSTGVSMLEDLEGMQELAKLIRVSSIDEGYEYLDSGKAMFFFIVPENFFTGIMNGTNPPLEIILRDNSSMFSFIANELFLSYARYLGVAQASVYSALDTAHYENYDSEAINRIQTDVNVINLSKVLTKDNYFVDKNAAFSSDLSIFERYLAVVALLATFFSAFALSSWYRGIGQGMEKCFILSGTNKFSIWLSYVIAGTPAYFSILLVCKIITGIMRKDFNVSGLFYGLILSVIISASVALINQFTKNRFSANIALLVIIIVVAYCGGGLLPDSFLPRIIQQISRFMPGPALLRLAELTIF